MKLFMPGAILTLALFAATFPVSGQVPPAAAPAAKAGGPRIQFSEPAFDFGKIAASDTPAHTFYATNVGDADLEITAVNPGCGCTTAGEWDRKIQPGKFGKIPIKFDPSKFNGRVTNKYVSITCNDSVQPLQTLYLHATVWRPIDVQPAHVYFMPVEGETTNETRTVKIVSELPEPLTLEAPECTNKAFKLELKAVKPGKEFELRVAYDPPASNAVPNTLITIKTSSTNMPVVNVSAYAMVQPALVAMPGQVRLPSASTPVGYKHSALIRNNGSLPVKLSDAAVNAEGVTVQIIETQPGKLFNLSIDIPPNFEVRPGLELTAKTTHPKYPVFRVPIVPPAPQIPPITKPPTRASGSQ